MTSTPKRRRMLAVAGIALTTTIGLTACGAAKSGGSGGSATGGKTVQMYISGDTNVRDLWKNKIIPGFEKANKGYSAHVTFSAHGANDTPTLAGIGASIKSKKAPAFDLLEGAIPLTLAQNDWGIATTTKQVPSLSEVPKVLQDPARNEAAAYRGTTVVLAYNSKFVTTPPKTLADLIAWIKAHPGKFAYNTPDSGGSGQSFVLTVLDQYMPAAVRTKMVNGDYTAGEKYWSKGLTELKGLKQYMYQKTYPTGNQATLDLLAASNIYLAPVWVDQTLTGIGNGSIPKTVKLTQISDPSFTGGASYLGIPKTSKNADAAFKLIDYALHSTAQADIANVLSGFPVIPISQLPAALRTKFQGLSNMTFRPTYNTEVMSDMNQQWQKSAA
ncbi:MAG: extracellular solute-binding protein [Mycobacteriales bacterium]